MKKVVKRLVLPAVLAGLAMEAYQYLGEFSMSHEQVSGQYPAVQAEAAVNTSEPTAQPENTEPDLNSFLAQEPSEDERFLLDVQYICQKPDYPTGCESVSSVMLLNAAGISIDVDTFIDSFLHIEKLVSDESGTHGPHPDEAFIGDPRGRGFGCYAPVIVSALEQAAPEYYVLNETGKTLEELTDTYVKKGTPVLVWATINMTQSKPGASWRIDSTGEEFVWKQGEHCLVLIGYDTENYYMADPYTGEPVTVYEKSLLQSRYEEMGMQAVTIVKKPQ